MFLKSFRSFVLFAVFLSGCGKQATTTKAQSKLDPIEINTVSAVSYDVARSLRATGTLTADDAADVTAKVSERVVSVPVSVGQHVNQGDVLLELDKGNLELRLQQAQSAEQQSRSSVVQAESRLGLKPGVDFDVNQVPEVISARVNVETAKSQATLAASNAKRYSEVLKTGDVSQSAYDQAVQQARAAEDQAHMAEQQYAIAMNGARQSYQMVVGARASLANSQVQVAMAQNDLGNTSVKAPFTGYVAELPVGRGQLVGPTVKVATLVQIDTLVAKLQVPEAEQSQLKTGLRVVAKVAAYPDRDFTGTLTSVDPSIDVAGRSITILVRIPNPGGLLRPGMFASARVELPQSTKIVYVPLDAVVTQAGSASSSVFVVDGQSVTQKLVRLGDRDSRGVGIVTGLDAGARVAVGNLTQLFDGAPVTIRNRS